ncbi:MAG: hypothetical protein A2Y69_03510 [Candidatus Aminicenantes bacterium RBG_13_59_9]|jgi:hypothetical protein|nr:MAG: hypothetical protein A2Y69_03510 [Candidatus Aminicenantes bacterium RBG_13_59_9]
MSKIEPWRLKELALLLDEIKLILESGENPEWSRVFEHFGTELEILGSARPENQAGLKKLVRSIQLCLDAGGGFSRLVLEVPDSDEGSALSLRFGRLRKALAKAVDDIGERMVEYVH